MTINDFNGYVARFFESLTRRFTQASADQLGADTLVARAKRGIALVLPTHITCIDDIVLVPERLTVELADLDMRLLLRNKIELEHKLSAYAARVAREHGQVVDVEVRLRKAEGHLKVKVGHPVVRVAHGSGDNPGLLAPATTLLVRR